MIFKGCGSKVKAIEVPRFSLAISAGTTILFALAAPLLIRLYPEEFASSLPLFYLMAAHPLLAGLGVALGPFFRTVDRVGTSTAVQLPVAAVLLPAGWFAIEAHGAWGAAVTTVALRVILRGTALTTAMVLLRRGKIFPEERDQGTNLPG